MAEQPASHFSDGEKIICGVTKGTIAKGTEKVTCGRCLALLRKTQQTTPPAPAEDPKAVHFSDGTKAVCGAQQGTAVKDEQKVTCQRCAGILAKKAQGEGDPLVTVRVKNQDLNDGVDFAFTYEGKPYHLVNNAVHKLPRSVVEHLRRIAYPYKRYVPPEEGGVSGHAMQVAGQYRRFAVTEIE